MTTKEQDSKSIGLKVGFWLLVALVLVFNLFPAIVCACFLVPAQSGALLDAGDSHSLTLAHYQAVFADARFVKSLRNPPYHRRIHCPDRLGTRKSPRAYALGRLPFRFKGSVLYLVLTMTMFPQIAVLSGLFVMLKGLGLFNTRPGLVLTYLIFTMPFTVWVMTQVLSQPSQGT